MILAIDVGNTNVKLGIYDGDNLIFRSRLSTDRSKTTDEFAIEFSSVFSIYHIDAHCITGVCISCVVPSISYHIKKAVMLLTGVTPIEVDSKTDTGLNVLIDNPSTLGADLAVSCVACKNLYSTPCIIINLGTATTFSVLDKDKNMRGGLIMPGVLTSLKALTDKTSLLPSISLNIPKKTVASNTEDCIRSGSVLGTASMIDGICERIESEMGEKCTVVATGGLSNMIVPYCRREIIQNSDLMMQGLKIIYDRNCKQ